MDLIATRKSIVDGSGRNTATKLALDMIDLLEETKANSADEIKTSFKELTAQYEQTGEKFRVLADEHEKTLAEVVALKAELEAKAQ